MNVITYPVFEGRKTISIPMDVFLDYEYKVKHFTQNTANCFMTVLELSEELTNEELSVAVIEAMKEDCADSTIVKELLSKNSFEI